MGKNEFLKEQFGVSDEIIKLIDDCEESVKPQFAKIEEIAQLCEMKVMKAFSDNRVSSEYFIASSGYGTDDIGRDLLDKIYAQVFEA